MKVRHLPDEKRFEITTDVGEAILGYDDSQRGVMDLQHTVVPEEAQGRGIGGQLVEAAVRHARDKGMRIVPTCPFVQHWLQENPEYGELVAR